MSAESRWRQIAEPQLELPDVTAGTGFSSSPGLRTGGKVFAMLINEELVVKLPKVRVDDLVADGVGRNFDPGHGRIMKEWISIPAAPGSGWAGLMEEARRFVGRV